MTSSGDWGVDAWGLGPWGGVGGSGGTLQLLGCVAVAENRVRAVFSVPVSFTGLGGAGDGADRNGYLVTANGGAALDGLPTRDVAVVLPSLVLPNVVDLWLDRRLSPYASLYTLTIVDLVGAAAEPLDPFVNAFDFLGLAAGIETPTLEASTPSRDFAHPDTLSAQLDPLPNAGQQAALGGIPVDAGGDYATDQGIVGYRKRLFRRLLAKRGGYSHLPATYGLGLLQQVKKLARATDRQRIASDAEVQILQEPETIKCRVAFVAGFKPGLWRLVVLAQTKPWGNVKLEQDLVG